MPEHAPGPSSTSRLLHRLARPAEAALVTLCVVGGSVLRLTPSSPLWLDEALTVNIASAPVGDIGELLRHDGHPPLYYYVLHAWMALFGEGAFAVRSLSAVFGGAALAMLFVVARRHGGGRVATYAVAVMAVAPFAIRYSSEARMYELVTLLALIGWWLADRALTPSTELPPDAGRAAGAAERRRAGAELVALWAVCGALLLTHYWSIFLLATCGAGLLWRAWRTPAGATRRTTVRVIGAVALSGVWFAPWLSAFAYQSAHTGTPWAPASRPTRVVSESLLDWAGGNDPEPLLLLVVLAVLATLGLFATTGHDARLRLGAITPGWRRRVAFVLGGTLVVGSLASWVSAAAFAGRYSSAVFPLYVLLVGTGLAGLSSRPVRVSVLAVVIVLAAGGVALAIDRDRTQAGVVAAMINAEAQPGDLVVVCPDQLGPALSRLVRAPGVTMVRYPDLGDPHFVDWVDYQDRLDAVSVPAVAESILAAAGSHDIWFVWSGTYRVAGPQCDELSARLGAARPGAPLLVETDAIAYFEPASLIRLAAR